MTREDAIEIVRLTCPRIVDSDCDFETAMRTLVPELEQTSDSDEQIKTEIKEILRAACISDGRMTYSKYITYSAWLDKKVNSTFEEFTKELENTSREIKTKFRIGDFISDGVYCRGQVVSITKDSYLLDTGQEIPFSCGDKIHYWTLHDAKDGDILVTKKDKRPFIFKGLLDPDHPEAPVAYGGMDCWGELLVSSGLKWWTDEEVMPAVKEDRERLFKEINNRGYLLWDA